VIASQLVNKKLLSANFRFFNKMSTVVSCDCFVIIMFPGKEKFEV